MHKMNRILSVTLLVLQVTSLCSALECFQTCLENCNTGICAGRCGKALGSTGQFQLPGFISVFCNETEGDSCVNTEVFSLFGNTGDGEWLSLPRGCLFDYVDSKVRELQLLLNLGTQLFSCETDGCNIPSLAACTLAQATTFTETGDITNPCYATVGRSVFEDKVRGGPHDIDMRGRCVNDLIISTELVQVDQDSGCFANKQVDGATAAPSCSERNPPRIIESVLCSECLESPNCDINLNLPQPTPSPTRKPTVTKGSDEPNTPEDSEDKGPSIDKILVISVVVSVLILAVLLLIVYRSWTTTYEFHIFKGRKGSFSHFKNAFPMAVEQPVVAPVVGVTEDQSNAILLVGEPVVETRRESDRSSGEGSAQRNGKLVQLRNSAGALNDNEEDLTVLARNI